MKETSVPHLKLRLRHKSLPLIQMNKRQQLEKVYNVNSAGIIESPGRYEGEKIYVPYFYEAPLDRKPDIREVGMIGFIVNREDAELFPEFLKEGEIVKIHLATSAGTVYEAT